MMPTKKILYTVPVASTGFTTEAYWDGKGARPGIRFEYAKEGASTIHQGGIVFKRAIVLQKRSERCCTAWHIEGAYDNLVEVVDSPWIRSIASEITDGVRITGGMHHYMIYLDSVGCFEVIAESWSAVA
jgi:hypothetical protein